jgi:transposase
MTQRMLTINVDTGENIFSHYFDDCAVTMPSVPTYKRELVLSHYNDGVPALTISKMLNISRNAVRNIIKKAREGFPITDKPRTGRPSKLSARMKRALVLSSKAGPFQTARQVRDSCNLEGVVSVDTIKRVLRQNNLLGRTAASKPNLTKVQKRKRLLWCKKHLQCDSDFWGKVIYSDETRFDLHPKTRIIVRRPPGKRLADRYTKKTMKFSPGLMIWGAVRSDGTTVLEQCQGNVDSIEYQRILNEALPNIYTRRHLLQQDGATCHTSVSTKKYFAEKRVKILENWPPQSPDLNIIENLWSDLKVKVYSRAPTTVNELWQYIQDEWNNFSTERIQKLYETIPRRVKAVVKAGGGSTKY